jgi:hypothetical protein
VLDALGVLEAGGAEVLRVLEFLGVVLEMLRILAHTLALDYLPAVFLHM